MATELYESNDSKIWTYYLNKYDNTIKLVAKNKNNQELIQLDNWLWNELKNNVYSRYNCNKADGYYLTKNELSNIMKWKLIRGQFRPLQHMIDSNDSNFVKLCSKNALNILLDNNIKINWKKAIKELTMLKGVGVATASIILAVFCPELCPFMSDELIKTVYKGKLDYTQKTYDFVQRALLEKLNNLDKNTLNVEMLGKALWVADIMH